MECSHGIVATNVQDANLRNASCPFQTEERIPAIVAIRVDFQRASSVDISTSGRNKWRITPSRRVAGSASTASSVERLTSLLRR